MSKEDTVSREWQDRFAQIESDYLKKIENASDSEQLEKIDFELFSKRGIITEINRSLRDQPKDQRPILGKQINTLKNRLISAIEEKKSLLKAREIQRRLEEERIDVSIPVVNRILAGGLHPVMKTLERIVDIFMWMGFDVENGPEIEDDYHNFKALNFPDDHPARDMQDTIYIEDGRLLRTHTSPVQIRAMKRRRPPMMFIAPGRVYRHDYDMTHSPVFHQVEGFAIGENINMSHLKGTLHRFVIQFFERDINIRFRPSFFPFTEPSCEVDIECVICGGKGCRSCGGTGWMEVLGAGMVHPNVLREGGVDPERYCGYAFGMGVERLTMLRYGISDLRLFFENAIDFLTQFRQVE